MRGKRSPIWNHFTINDDKSSAKCNYCSRNIRIMSGNSGNLVRHMNSKHPTIALHSTKKKPIIVEVMTDQNSTSTNADMKNMETITMMTHGEATDINNEPEILFLLPSSSKQKQSHIPDYVQDTKPLSPQNGIPQYVENRISLSPQSDMHHYVQSTRPLSPQNDMQQYVQNTGPLSPQYVVDLDEQLIKMIAREYHPFRIVEAPEFKKLIAMLNPRYSLPSRKTLANELLPRVYAQVHHEVEQLITAAQDICLCLPTNARISINKESFIAVIAHYIDENCDMRSNLLFYIQCDEALTNESLCNILKQEMDKWKITHKVGAIVSDNTGNIMEAILSGGWHHIDCFANILNSVVQTGIKEIQKTVNKVKQIVKFFKRNTQAQGILELMQKEMGTPDVKLIDDFVNKWNSIYDMLNRFSISKNAVVETLAQVDDNGLILSIQDWKVIKEVVPILKILNQVITEILSDQQVYLSAVIVYCRLLNLHLAKWPLQSHSSETVKMIESLKTQMHQRFCEENDVESNLLYAEATILDPRFKHRGFTDVTKYNIALSVLKRNIGDSVSSSPSLEGEFSHYQQGEVETDSIWEDFDKEVSVLTRSKILPPGHLEINRYLQEPMLNRCENPLKWWQERQPVFPILYTYAIKRLNLVATSAPCGQAFSKPGLAMAATRTQLKSKKFRDLIFIASNIKD